MRILPVLAIALFLVTNSLAQNTSALINEQLDKLVSLDFQQPVALPQALRAIEEQTGVPLAAQPVVWELLPWGEQTNFTAKVENRTLRDALGAILQKLGLTFVVKDESVEVQPVAALARLGRRSTVQELEALDLLASNPIKLDTDRPTVRQLVGAIDGKLVELKSPFAIENRAGDATKQQLAVFVPRNSTLLEALESIAKDTPVTWYPWGRTILIIPKEDQFRNLLSKTVTTRYNGVDVWQVLTELSRASGVPFAIEPGAVQRVPAEFRSVRLVLDNVTVQQALDTIAGFTGLGYVVNERGVYVWNQTGGEAARGRDPLIGAIQLDNGVQVFIPQSQIPADLREYIKFKTQKELTKLREMMEEEGFRPTTQPAATQPSPDL